MVRLALLFLAACSYEATLSPGAQADHAVVVTSDCDGSRYGSGVLIGPETALTAAHAVPCDDAEVEGAPATVETIGADVAILHLAEPVDALTVSIGPRPRIGNRICLEPAIPQRRRSCGWVLGIEQQLVIHSAPVWPGNSGAGVWDDEGRLVAIAVGQHRSYDDYPMGGAAELLAPWEGM